MPTDGMAASPLPPKGRDILLETGMVLKRIRHWGPSPECTSSGKESTPPITS